jgi:PAS domain S-box-containing protein
MPSPSFDEDDLFRSSAPEERERAAAWRRGEERERMRAAGKLTGRHVGSARASVAADAFAALAENVRDYAIFLMNRDGVITFWGEGARLIKWWTQDQVEGAHLRLLYPAGGSNDGTAEAHIDEAARCGEYTGEGQRVRSDGSTFWAGVTITTLRDENGEVVGFAKVTRDLTARRAADGLLQAAAVSAESARADAVAANRAKSGFLATMSHEIRTPVNAVMGYLDLLDLETDGPLNAAQRRHLERARASSRHLLELITEVLDFSRIEAERVSVDKAAFRVGATVTSALELISPLANARGLELADAVSGYAAGLAVWGDEGRVRQILVNLLSNAIKFTGRRGGEAGRITVSAGTATQPSPGARLEGSGPWVYLRVEDTGSGIPPDRLQAIFEPFVQADMTLTRTHGGTGLGLAISRRLARLMGGDVTARSEVGVGSTFFLWLPAAPVVSLHTGGLEGHGRAGGGRHDSEVTADRPSIEEGRPPGPLRSVADAVLDDLERVLHTYVARLRSDPGTPSAHAVDEAQVEDHLASFLADLSSVLTNLDGPVGEPTAAVRDGTAIQRVVAERHGAQRARLGWSEAEVRREFTILREELAAAVQRRAPARLRGPTTESRRNEAERALEVLTQFLATAEQLSLESLRHHTRHHPRHHEREPQDA